VYEMELIPWYNIGDLHMTGGFCQALIAKTGCISCFNIDNLAAENPQGHCPEYNYATPYASKVDMGTDSFYISLYTYAWLLSTNMENNRAVKLTVKTCMYMALLLLDRGSWCVLCTLIREVYND
jgi:hypothetical protein